MLACHHYLLTLLPLRTGRSLCQLPSLFSRCSASWYYPHHHLAALWLPAPVPYQYPGASDAVGDKVLPVTDVWVPRFAVQPVLHFPTEACLLGATIRSGLVTVVFEAEDSRPILVYWLQDLGWLLIILACRLSLATPTSTSFQNRSLPGCRRCRGRHPAFWLRNLACYLTRKLSQVLDKVS